MEGSLTDHLHHPKVPVLQISNRNLFPLPQPIILNSQELINKIFTTINCPDNQKQIISHKSSISFQDTSQNSTSKCNCKKSKCLKLYCECFAQGSFCNGCSCQCCHNTQNHNEERAKAIDELMNRTNLPFGNKSSEIKGCNCKKTGCQKKYCDCFRSGSRCNQYCKCCNCQNY